MGVGERNMLRSLDWTFGREVDFFYSPEPFVQQRRSSKSAFQNPSSAV
jgi:hypothetical protein